MRRPRRRSAHRSRFRHRPAPFLLGRNANIHGRRPRRDGSHRCISVQGLASFFFFSIRLQKLATAFHLHLRDLLAENFLRSGRCPRLWIIHICIRPGSTIANPSESIQNLPGSIRHYPLPHRLAAALNKTASCWAANGPALPDKIPSSRSILIRRRAANKRTQRAEGQQKRIPQFRGRRKKHQRRRGSFPSAG